MGSGGIILGGLLAGIGKGAQEDILARRQAALDDMRAQREAANITLRAKYEAENTSTAAALKYKNDRSLLFDAAGADVLKAKGILPTEQAKIRTKGEVDAMVETKRVQAETERDLAVERLKASGRKEDAEQAGILSRTTVETTYTNSEGRLVIVAKGGKVITTNIRGEAPKANAGGGDLTELRGGGGGDAAPPAAAPAPAPAKLAPKPTSAPKPAGKAIGRDELTRLYTQALNKAASGDVRFAGMSKSQIQAKIDDSVKNQGYTIPR